MHDFHDFTQFAIFNSHRTATIHFLFAYILHFVSLFDFWFYNLVVAIWMCESSWSLFYHRRYWVVAFIRLFFFFFFWFVKYSCLWLTSNQDTYCNRKVKRIERETQTHITSQIKWCVCVVCTKPITRHAHFNCFKIQRYDSIWNEISEHVNTSITWNSYSDHSQVNRFVFFYEKCACRDALYIHRVPLLRSLSKTFLGDSKWRMTHSTTTAKQ